MTPCRHHLGVVCSPPVSDSSASCDSAACSVRPSPEAVSGTSSGSGTSTRGCTGGAKSAETVAGRTVTSHVVCSWPDTVSSTCSGSVASTSDAGSSATGSSRVARGSSYCTAAAATSTAAVSRGASERRSAAAASWRRLLGMSTGIG